MTNASDELQPATDPPVETLLEELRESNRRLRARVAELEAQIGRQQREMGKLRGSMGVTVTTEESGQEAAEALAAEHQLALQIIAGLFVDVENEAERLRAVDAMSPREIVGMVQQLAQARKESP